MSINFDNITTLPEELNYKIFSFLDPIALGKCCLVNKKFNELASNDNLWKDMFSTIYFHSGISVKKNVDSYAVISFDEIFQRIKKFSTHFFADKVFEFKALFLFNPDCAVSFLFGYGKVNRIQEPDVKETCIFVNKLEGNAETKSMSNYNDLHNPFPYYQYNFDQWRTTLPDSKDKEILAKKIDDLIESIKKNLRYSVSEFR